MLAAMSIPAAAQQTTQPDTSKKAGVSAPQPDTSKKAGVSGTTTTTLGTFSNLNKGTGYVQRTFNLSAFTGRTITVRLTGAEDASLATSFLTDDFSVTTA